MSTTRKRKEGLARKRCMTFLHEPIIKGSQGYKCESAEKRPTRPSAPLDLGLCLFREALTALNARQCAERNASDRYRPSLTPMAATKYNKYVGFSALSWIDKGKARLHQTPVQTVYLHPCRSRGGRVYGNQVDC